MSDTQDKYFGYRLAGVNQRFMAYIIYVVILAVPVYYINTRLPVYSLYLKEHDLYPIFNYCLALLVGGIFYPLWAGNIGHKLLGLKVISAKDGSDVRNPFTGALLELIKTVFSSLTILWYVFNKNDQALHDSLFNTYVVKAQKELQTTPTTTYGQ